VKRQFYQEPSIHVAPSRGIVCQNSFGIDVVCVKWHEFGTSQYGTCQCSMGGNNKKSRKKYAMFSIKNWGLNQPYKETVVTCHLHGNEINRPLLEDGMVRQHVL
jgi:hypothetical protein